MAPHRVRTLAHGAGALAAFFAWLAGCGSPAIIAGVPEPVDEETRAAARYLGGDGTDTVACRLVDAGLRDERRFEEARAEEEAAPHPWCGPGCSSPTAHATRR